MGKIEETRAMMARVRFEIEQEVDLMEGRFAPPFKVLKDIVECGKQSIPVQGNLEGANINIICIPLKYGCRGEIAPASIWYRDKVEKAPPGRFALSSAEGW